MERHPLVDELLVIDSDSTDETREVAAGRGRSSRRPPAGPAALRQLSPARARRSGRACTRRAATSSSGPTRTSATGIRAWSTARSGRSSPRSGIQYVKGYYRRPIVEGGVLKEGGGGRVTELVARPLHQPLLPRTVRPDPAAVRRVRRPAQPARDDPVLHGLRGGDRPSDRRRRARRARRAWARWTWSGESTATRNSRGCRG